MENKNQGCDSNEELVSKDNQFYEVGKSNEIKLKTSDLNHLNRFE